MKSHLSSPWSELLLFNLTGYINNADFIPVPPSSERCICGFISFFLKAGPWSFCSSRTVLLAFPQICWACTCFRALHLYLLQLESALPAGSAQLAHALPSDPLHVSHFRLPLLGPLVKSQPCPPLCLTLFGFSLWYLQILSIYDYYLSFSLGCKPLEYEDFITVVYCFSICNWHSKL